MKTSGLWYVFVVISASVITVVIVSPVIGILQGQQIRAQQRQIDQLCKAMHKAVTHNGEGEVEPCNYSKLKPGGYVLYFANYGTDSATTDYVPMDDTRRSSNLGAIPWRPHYVRIYDIPKDILKDWEWGEIRKGPNLER